MKLRVSWQAENCAGVGVSMKLFHIPLLVVGVQGHGSMIMPDSRNSVDASPGMPWANGKHPETGLIEPYTCACGNGTDLCSSGQVFICAVHRVFVSAYIVFSRSD